MLRRVGLGFPLLIVLMWGATAARTTLVGAGRDVFEDCFGAELFVDDLLDEDLVGLRGGMMFYLLVVMKL